MELHLSLAGRLHLGRQIYEQLRGLILEGRLCGGERLPATRSLAQRLGVSRNTVSNAYERLMAEGYLRGRIGDGTYVAEGAPWGRSEAFPRADATEVPAPSARWPAARSAALPYDFLLGVPDVARFPFDVWRRFSNQALRSLAKEMTLYGAPEGLSELREAIAGYIAFTRGVRCRAEDVIVTNGAQQALDLVGRVLIEPGTVIAAEEPGYPPARSLFTALGGRVVGVPVDDDGLMVERLPTQASLAYVTPSHQFPLGVPLSLPRRIALIEWAAAKGAIVIEDDYDSEFRFEGRSLEALQSLDSAGCVVHVGSFSKVLSPALRLGFLIVPPALRESIVAMKRLTDWQSPVHTQMVLAAFIRTGHLSKHIRMMRRIYEQRRHILLDRLAADFHTWLDPAPGVAGLHVAATFKCRVEVGPLVTVARTHGVGVYDLGRFYAESPPTAGLIFGYGGIEEGAIRQGLTRLRELVQQATRTC